MNVLPDNTSDVAMRYRARGRLKRYPYYRDAHNIWDVYYIEDIVKQDRRIIFHDAVWITSTLGKVQQLWRDVELKFEAYTKLDFNDSKDISLTYYKIHDMVVHEV